MKHIRRTAGAAVLATATVALLGLAGHAQNAAPTPTSITVDVAANRHPISPLIYGVCFGSTDQLQGMNATINRQGGNNFTRYNWKENTVQLDNDWYYTSIPGFFLHMPTTLAPGERADDFIAASKAAGAEPMISIGMIGWAAKVTDGTTTLYSYSVKKYGPQQKTDPEIADAGNGKKPDGTPITNNDPNDANIPITAGYQKPWVQHLVDKWGGAANGGLKYYILDNEPGLWNSTHQDVHPIGFKDDEYLNDFLTYSTMIKSIDPKAMIVAPESWGWPEFNYSGFDWQYMGAHNYQGHPDMDAHGGLGFIPWLLTKIHQHDEATGKRSLDVFTFHWYPQTGDNNNNTDPKTELIRNQSTRTLWDPNYVENDWVNASVHLIPRMRDLVNQYYPGTKIGITEYNWGGESSMSGATAQADILGIFGREDVYLATRWTAPDATTPPFHAFQIFRNYDGNKSTFGDVSVSDTTPNSDQVSSFAAVRSSDNALTIVVDNKQLSNPADVSLNLLHTTTGATAHAWQLAGDGSKIVQIADVPVAGNSLETTVPPQSVTIFVIPPK